MVVEKDVVVDTPREYVAAVEDLLHTIRLETTVDVEAGQVYKVSAVPITPVDARAPSLLIDSAILSSHR